MQHDAGLVVDYAAAEQPSVPLDGTEGREIPRQPVSGRLHVMMCIQQHGRISVCRRFPGQYCRPSGPAACTMRTSPMPAPCRRAATAPALWSSSAGSKASQAMPGMATHQARQILDAGAEAVIHAAAEVVDRNRRGVVIQCHGDTLDRPQREELEHRPSRAFIYQTKARVGRDCKPFGPAISELRRTRHCRTTDSRGPPDPPQTLEASALRGGKMLASRSLPPGSTLPPSEARSW